MPLPFDATLKNILQKFTHDFEEQLGLVGPQPATVLNVDLSTVSAATDIVLGYGDPLVQLVDLNFQSSFSRSTCHERIIHLPGHSRRRAD